MLARGTDEFLRVFENAARLAGRRSAWFRSSLPASENLHRSGHPHQLDS
jgi:hypothetical protein